MYKNVNQQNTIYSTVRKNTYYMHIIIRILTKTIIKIVIIKKQPKMDNHGTNRIMDLISVRFLLDTRDQREIFGNSLDYFNMFHLRPDPDTGQPETLQALRQRVLATIRPGMSFEEFYRLNRINQ